MQARDCSVSTMYMLRSAWRVAGIGSAGQVQGFQCWRWQSERRSLSEKSSSNEQFGWAHSATPAEHWETAEIRSADSQRGTLSPSIQCWPGPMGIGVQCP